MCTMGDGTTNIGAFHESLNIAALWNLPVVYVIINNGLGMGTTVAKSSAEPDLYKRGAAYRMESARVDGIDPVAVRDAAAKAVEAARPGRPYLLEVITERLRGHSVVDPAKYRTARGGRAAQARGPDPALRRQADRGRRARPTTRSPRSSRRSRASWRPPPTSPRRARTRRCPRCSTTPTPRRSPTTRAACRASRCSIRPRPSAARQPSRQRPRPQRRSAGAHA